MEGDKVIIHFYSEFPDAERLAKMTIEELDEEIKRKLEESKNMSEWPKVE